MSESKTQKVWWFLGAIGTAAVVGYSANYFQTATDAKEQHEMLKAAAAADIAEQSERNAGQDARIQDIVVRNVRIEYGIQQIQDELRRARIDSQRARTREEREAQVAELDLLEERIQRRESALQRSYEQRPLIPGGASSDGLEAIAAEAAE